VLRVNCWPSAQLICICLGAADVAAVAVAVVVAAAVAAVAGKLQLNAIQWPRITILNL